MSEQNERVETLGTWLEHYLGNYTFPANYAAPLYGQTHREVAKYVGQVIAEDLLDSPAMRDLLAEAWDSGWHEHYLEEVRQDTDPTHPITKNNPYRGQS